MSINSIYVLCMDQMTMTGSSDVIWWYVMWNVLFDVDNPTEHFTAAVGDCTTVVNLK